jgi:uncharacterized protein YbjQ (UPF0145 family)
MHTMDPQDPKTMAIVASQPYPIAPFDDIAHHVTTANHLEGFRIVQTIGIVRGIVVRSRSIVGNFGAAIQMIFGGNITIYTELCEQARQDAFRIMVEHARRVHANAVVAMRYDATEIMQGVSEVLAYGTAVRVEPLQTATPFRD